jgi:hypothetical protein
VHKAEFLMENTPQTVTPSVTIADKWKNHTFKEPKKSIATMEDHEKFKKSKTYVNYMQFLAALQKSVESKKFSDTPANPKFAGLADMLNDFEKWVTETPPLKQPMRFGNKAFQTLQKKVADNADPILAKILPEELKGAIIELKTYLVDSFGSNIRIDYGTGHEMNFIMFLFCLKELGLYEASDYEGLVRNVFYRYIKLMRAIQMTYMLEPAGSHGVWGLDDYHFLPFLFGASELIDNQDIPTPDSIHKDYILKDYSDEYMYLSCIKFIKEVKKGVPFQESSPMLNDISAAPTWQKVAAGMVKMYQAEVLHKFPVAKHMYFGTIIPFE